MAASFPHTVAELDRLFRDEDSCRAYLVQLRWPEGFVCPRCQGKSAWLASRGRFVCRQCRHQATVSAGTVFQDTRLPLRLWFHAIWQIVSQKNGASAASVQRSLGLRSYQTAWAWLHKVRRAMVLPGRTRLQGSVEVDETIVGGPEPGTWGASLGQRKYLVAIAAEYSGSAIGRIRLAPLRDRTRQQLHQFVSQSIEKGSEVVTDGLAAYTGLEALGYQHQPASLAGRPKSAAVQELPRVHRVAALLKRWLLGTHHGRIGPAHLEYYLDEFTFRFNRRRARTPGLLFHALLQQAVREEPAPYHTLIQSKDKPQ